MSKQLAACCHTFFITNEKNQTNYQNIKLLARSPWPAAGHRDVPVSLFCVRTDLSSGSKKGEPIPREHLLTIRSKKSSRLFVCLLVYSSVRHIVSHFIHRRLNTMNWLASSWINIQPHLVIVQFGPGLFKSQPVSVVNFWKIWNFNPGDTVLRQDASSII